MHPQTVHATTPSPHTMPLAAVRAAVLARRVKASPSVAALARRARISLAHAAALAEAHGIGGAA